jgi:hypothetical protein
MDKKTLKAQLEAAGEDDEPVLVHVITMTEDIWVDITQVAKNYAEFPEWIKGTVIHAKPIYRDAQARLPLQQQTSRYSKNKFTPLSADQKKQVSDAILDVAMEEAAFMEAAEKKPGDQIASAGTEHIGLATSYRYQNPSDWPPLREDKQYIKEHIHRDTVFSADQVQDPSEAEVYDVPSEE